MVSGITVCSSGTIFTMEVFNEDVVGAFNILRKRLAENEKEIEFQ